MDINLIINCFKSSFRCDVQVSLFCTQNHASRDADENRLKAFLKQKDAEHMSKANDHIVMLRRCANPLWIWTMAVKNLPKTIPVQQIGIN